MLHKSAITVSTKPHQTTFVEFLRYLVVNDRQEIMLKDNTVEHFESIFDMTVYH